MGNAVVLSTARLEMRPLTTEHLADMLGLYEDPRVTRFLVPLDEVGQLRRLQDAERMWADRGYGRAAMYEKDTARFVGRGGLSYWPQFDEVEVGWALRADAWGRGYATEAGAAWIHWAFRYLDVPYITACISPDNHASASVARRLGMSVLRTDTLHGREVAVYAIGPPDAVSGEHLAR